MLIFLHVSKYAMFGEQNFHAIQMPQEESLEGFISEYLIHIKIDKPTDDTNVVTAKCNDIVGIS